MAKPRQSIAHAALTGTLRSNRGRYVNRDAFALCDQPLGAAPAHFSPNARQAWADIERWSPGVRRPHRIAVELAAQLLAEQRSDPAGFSVAKYAALRAALRELGVSMRRP
jgi:hypothetical protein